MMKITLHNTLQRTASALGIYASLLGIEHGLFQIMRTGERPASFFIYAIGPDCDPSQIWHACFPALSVLPTYLASGLSAVLISLYLLVWAADFTKTRYAAQIIAVFSLLLLPFGGGFVPVYTGLLASLALFLTRSPRLVGPHTSTRISVGLSRLWLPALFIYFVWFPLSWIFGYFFNNLMLFAAPLSFLFFDILLPAFVLFSAFQNQKLAGTDPDEEM